MERLKPLKQGQWRKGIHKKKALIMKKPFHQQQCLNLSEFSCPLLLIMIMRFGKWMLRLHFLMAILMRKFMLQLEGFIAKNQEHMAYKLKRSIYGVKQASRSWNIIFDQAIKSFGFEQNLDEPCVYKRHQDEVVMFLVLYVDVFYSLETMQG